jgi:hypothetical protein
LSNGMNEQSVPLKTAGLRPEITRISVPVRS